MSSFEQELRARLTSGELHLAEAAKADLDYPAFSELELGRHIDDYAAVLFLDIRGFTRLSMALPVQETARIVNAVVGAAAARLRHYQAHINDFTGDGVMAVFSEQEFESPDETNAVALLGVSHLMAEMSATLRPELLGLGIADPVQVAIGLYSGAVRWQRVGIEECSRLMILGEVAPLAAKYVTDETTLSWEVVAGGPIVDQVPLRLRERRDDFVREYDGQKLKRPRWLLKTEQIYQEVPDLTGARTLVSEALAATAPALLGAVPPAPKRRGSNPKPDRGVG